MSDAKNDPGTTGLLRLRRALTASHVPTFVLLTDAQAEEVQATLREAYRAAEAHREELVKAAALAAMPSEGQA
jgi:hypothetical protein